MLFWVKASLLVLFWTRCSPCGASFRGNNGHLYTLLTGGLPAILWDSVSSLSKYKDNVNISSQCQHALETTRVGLEEGSEWAFRFIDASGKPPSNLMEGTLSSFGDFDECQAIQAPFVGKYCMVRLIANNAVQSEASNATKALNRAIPVAKFLTPHLGICIPTGCSAAELSHILTNAMESFPFTVKGAPRVYCDDEETEGLTLKTATIEQIVSLLFIGGLIVCILIATWMQLKWGSSAPIVHSLSLVQNTVKLFEVKNEPRNNAVDGFKVMFAVFTVIAHALACIDSPYGGLVIDRMVRGTGVLTEFFVQPLINTAGLEIMFFMGGLTTMFALLSEKTRVSLVSPIVDKYVRYLPRLVGMMALEFIWPLLGSGPLYSLISRHILNNCSNNWWMNVLFISNYRTATSICMGHTFHSSVDFQLFILGLFAVYILQRHRRLGLALISAMIPLGICLTAYSVYEFEITPTLLSHELSVRAMVRYLDYYHFATYGHIDTYFAGILVGYFVKRGAKVMMTQRNRKVLIIFCFALFLCAVYGSSLHNVFNVLPASMYPAFIIAAKYVHILPFVLFMTTESPSAPSAPSKNAKQPKADHYQYLNKEVVSFLYVFFVIISKLSFSIYMVNYYCIRYDFFTSRQLFESTSYHLFKRILFYFNVTLLAAYLFHVIIEAPFDNMRRQLWPKLDVTKTKGA